MPKKKLKKKTAKKPTGATKKRLGRPPAKIPRESTSFRLPVDSLAQVDKIAQRESVGAYKEITRTDVLNKILGDYLRDKEDFVLEGWNDN